MQQFLLIGLALTAMSQPLAAETDPLPKLTLQPTITLSGLYSGAYMAGQYHLMTKRLAIPSPLIAQI